MKKKNFLLYAGTVLLCICLCMRSETALCAAKEALTLCAERVIPGLFPFFVLSSFWVRIGFMQLVGRWISPLSEKMFCVSGGGAVAFVMGLLCGYPTGAKVIKELYETKQIEKKEAEKLLPFCNNSGPLFVIGVVGGMLMQENAGLYLYGIHVVSALAVGMVFSCFAEKETGTKAVFCHTVFGGNAFSESVTDSVKTILEVCGYIVLFSVIRRLFLSERSVFFAGVSEVTAGTYLISASDMSQHGKMIVLSAVIGFGGLCVLLQVWGIVSHAGISMKYYIVGKILQALIAASVAQNPVVATTVIFMGILILRIRKLTKSTSGRIIKEKTKQRRQEGHESLSVFGR